MRHFPERRDSEGGDFAAFRLFFLGMQGLSALVDTGPQAVIRFALLAHY